MPLWLISDCSWVDGRFVHVLTPNIYRTLAEALQTFDYITKTGNFGFMDRELARWSGVAIMVRARAQCRQRACCGLPWRLTWLTAHAVQYTLSHTRLKKRHNITDERAALYEEVRPAWRAQLLCGTRADECNAPLPTVGWQMDVRDGGAQIHGRRAAQPGRRVRAPAPHVPHTLTPRDALRADISFFGVLRAVHDFDTFKDVMANTTLQPWCARAALRSFRC